MTTSNSLRNAVAIVGVGESEIGKLPTMSGLGLNAQAAHRALDDAGIPLSEIDGVLTAHSMTEPYFMLGTVLAEYLGIKPRLCASTVVGGASPGVMLKQAAQAIATGQAKTVLVCAGENRATGQSRDQALAALTAVGHPYFESPYGGSIPAFYGMIARRYMYEFGLTERAMAAVAVTARAHAAMHPNAQMRRPISIEDVLASKPIADPLKMLDCCLLSDAGGAFIVTSADRAKSTRAPVWLAGIGEFHTHEHLLCAPSLTEFGTLPSGEAAFQMAGLTPADVDVAELYDCFSIVPILEIEELGLCARGEGGHYFEEGRGRIGAGAVPINTHGGMLSHAHAGAAGGLLAIIEAVRQLRGGLGERQVPDASVALVHNEGGIMSSHSTMLFTREPR